MTLTPGQESWAKALCNCGVPPVEAKMLALDAIRDTECLGYAKQFMREAVETPGRTLLVLAGPTGVGKTIAACWVLRQRILDHASGTPRSALARFRHVSKISEVGLFGGEEDRKYRRDLEESVCLVIDDAGAEYQSDVFGALFDSLINYRYGSTGLTVITTNLPSEEFSRRYGARVLDRIRGRGAWYEINHESLRSQP